MKPVVGYIEGLEDKVLGYMVMFSVPTTILVPVEHVRSVLTEYQYENYMEIPTPQKAFRKAMKHLRDIEEVVRTKIRGKEVKIRVKYDTVQVGKTEYLIRKFKIETDSKKKDKVDTDRIARLYLDESGNLVVEPITRHIGSTKVAINEEDAKKIQDFLSKYIDRYLHLYDGDRIRAFIRDKILRENCRAIPFVGRGGAWFVPNNEDNAQHLINLREVVNKFNERSSNGAIKLMFVPLFDSEDVKQKIKEDIAREVTAKYKSLLNEIMLRILHAKSGEQIEKILEEYMKGENTIISMIEEYANIIKDRLRVEIESLEGVKSKLIEAIEEKAVNGIDVDVERAKLIINTIGNYRNDAKGIEVLERSNEQEETEEIKLIDEGKINILVKELDIDKFIEDRKGQK